MASSLRLHPPRPNSNGGSSAENPLPPLIRTPSGLAIMELQGTINLPQVVVDESGRVISDASGQIELGRIVFPDHHPETEEPGSTAWMKRVHFYVGQNQRLTGEVKKLPRAWAIIRKIRKPDVDVDSATSVSDIISDDLEIVEIIKYRLLFSHRPEPVGND